MADVVKKERSASIDMIKGLSIMTLFFLHFENGWMHIDYNIFIVRSPAFYIVVGWLWGMSSNKRTVNEHWMKRKKGLVIPYLWFSLIFIALDIALISLDAMRSEILLRDIYKTCVLRGIGTLWFLPALLGGEMLFIKIRDNSWMCRILSLAFAAIGIYLFKQCLEIKYFQYEKANEIIAQPIKVLKDVATAFFYISFAYYISSQKGKQIFNSRKSILVFAGLIFSLIAFCLANIDYLHGFGGHLQFLFMNCLAGIGVLMMFRGLESFALLAKPLVYFGKNSLVVMTMHWFLFTIVLAIDSQLFNNELYSGNRTVVYYIIGVFAMCGIIELINRKFPFIIGK